MKAARIHSFGGPQVISVEEAPLPTVSAAEDVLVQVHAAGVNPIDWLFRNGFGKDMFHHRLPLTLGCDVSGVVEQVGSDVRRFKADDAVYGYLNTQRLQLELFIKSCHRRDGAVRREPGREPRGVCYGN